MNDKSVGKKIALIGGGPAALFMFKRLVDSNSGDFTIHIYERKNKLGAGMPYSEEGANVEHVTNVSGNEIPEIIIPVSQWLQSVPKDVLNRFKIDPEQFSDYRVLPRLLFGEYLAAQFQLLLKNASQKGMQTTVHLSCNVTDVFYEPEEEKVLLSTEKSGTEEFDFAVICTGHKWPKKYEGTIPQYFDSPYPPSKLALKFNHPVAIKGSSLTAIDAIRTIARTNGIFQRDKNGKLTYHLADDNKDFSIAMHSINGFLPAVRIHLEDSHLGKDSVLSREQVAENIKTNGGFLSLDYVFDKNFREPFREKDPVFYNDIKNMSIESFVDHMMSLREELDAFQLLKAEYAEAEKSIKRKQSVYWKEMLAVLSFTMNYPAKHFSAEDMIRLQKVLMPLISVVIAFVPQSSCDELIALYDAGLLKLIAVGHESNVEPVDSGGALYHYLDESNKKEKVFYRTFINCVGQPHLSIDDFPFKGLKMISPALLKFKSQQQAEKEFKQGNKNIHSFKGEYYLEVPGIAINDNFQPTDRYGAVNNRIFIMAVPYISGYNPDYSGLDFCEAASAIIMKSILNDSLTSL
jgi:hypothetical protein